MPRGDKSSYGDKQKQKAEHIEEGFEDRGVSEKETAPCLSDTGQDLDAAALRNSLRWRSYLYR